MRLPQPVEESQRDMAFEYHRPRCFNATGDSNWPLRYFEGAPSVLLSGCNSQRAPAITSLWINLWIAFDISLSHHDSKREVGDQPRDHGFAAMRSRQIIVGLEARQHVQCVDGFSGPRPCIRRPLIGML